MSIALPSLPYPRDALEPYLSRRAVELHHTKHHGGYVTKVNSLIADTRLSNAGLREIIVSACDAEGGQELYNAASQAWNHAFFWHCMRRGGGGAPRGDIKRRICADFGDYETFAAEFAVAATGWFGSGWTWLTLFKDKLNIVSTANADAPRALGHTPLLTIDVWEHAYYVDYENRRAEYVKAFLEHLVDWTFVNEILRSDEPRVRT